MSEIEHVGDAMRRSLAKLADPDHDYAEDAAVERIERIRKFLVSRAVSSLANQSSGVHLVRRLILEFINEETT